jgi:hypothetical protein
MGSTVEASLWFFLLCILMLALHEIYGPLLRKKVLKALILPGLASLLVFKILCCAIMGAKVIDTKLLDDDKEILHYAEPRTGWFGHFVIAVVPFFCLILLFCIVVALMGWPLEGLRPLPRFSLLWHAPGSFCSGFLEFLRVFVVCTVECGTENPLVWLLLALGVNVLLALAPTLRDFKYIAIAAGILLAVGLLFWALGLGLTERTEANAFIFRYVHAVYYNITFLLGLALLWLGGSLFTVGAYRAYSRAGEHREGKKKK